MDPQENNDLKLQLPGLELLARRSSASAQTIDQIALSPSHQQADVCCVWLHNSDELSLRNSLKEKSKTRFRELCDAFGSF